MLHAVNFQIFLCTRLKNSQNGWPVHRMREGYTFRLSRNADHGGMPALTCGLRSEWTDFRTYIYTALGLFAPRGLHSLRTNSCAPSIPIADVLRLPRQYFNVIKDGTDWKQPEALGRAWC